ncbi:MAG: hypothetical protein ACPHGY_02065, partial [Rhodospirillaceae bacterium]
MAAEKESSGRNGSIWGALTIAFVLLLGLSATYFLSRPMPEQARAEWNAMADAEAESLRQRIKSENAVRDMIAG